MPGAQCTRSLVCAGVVEYAHEYSQRRHRKHPAFPTQWFYGLYRALPGDRALLPPSLSRNCVPRNLSASVGAPGPHDFAVRFKRRSSCVASASTASHPAFVTTRTPLLSRRDGGNNTQFPIFGKRNFCAWRADNPNRLESSREIRSCAHAFSRCLRPRARRERRRIDQTDLPDAVRRAAFAVSVKSTRRWVRKSPRLLPAWNGQQSKARLAHVPLRSCASAKNKSFHDVGRCFKRPTLCMNATCFIRLAGAVV